MRRVKLLTNSYNGDKVFYKVNTVYGLAFLTEDKSILLIAKPFQDEGAEYDFEIIKETKNDVIKSLTLKITCIIDMYKIRR